MKVTSMHRGISILSGIVMIDLMGDGPSRSMQLLIVWTCERLKCRVANLLGKTLVGYLHMRDWTWCWLALNGSNASADDS
jgi:hypothetical protein